MSSIRNRMEAHKKSLRKPKKRTSVNLVRTRVKSPKSKDSRKLYNQIFLFAFAALFAAECSVRILQKFKMLNDFSTAYLEENVDSFFSSKTQWNAKRNTLDASETEKADWAVIGDEMLYGDGVAKEDTISNELSRLSNKRIVTLAAPDLNVGHYNQLSQFAEKYQPNTLVYFISANDFLMKDSVAVRQVSTQSKDVLKNFPHEVKEGDGANSFAWGWNKFFDRLPHHSALCQLFQSQSQGIQGETWKRNGLYFLMKPKAFWASWLDLKNENVEYGLEVNVEHFRMLKQYTKEKKENLVVFLIPSREMVYGGLNTESNKIWDESFGRTYDEFESRLDGMKVSVFDLTSELRDRARQGEKLYFSIKDGLTEKGHAAVAQIAYNKMSKSSSKK